VSSSFKGLTLILILLLLFFQVRLWFESGGVIDMMRIKKELAVQTAENEKLKQRNVLLINQVKGLQANNAAVEARARDELGMIKKGETFYQVVN